MDPDGEIHFSYMNIKDTLLTFFWMNNNTGDTMNILWRKMETQPAWITLEAGSFGVVNFHGTVYTCDPNPGVSLLRYMDKLYSKGVGMVFDTYYFVGSPFRFERRLHHYHVSGD